MKKKIERRITKKGYVSEILSFCQCMVQHAEEFEVNGEEVQQNASLLKHCGLGTFVNLISG